VLAGQCEVYSTLVKRYERAVRATAAAVLHDYHAAQDAAQEAFVEAYRKLSTLRNGSAFGAWILRIAYRQALRMAKARRRGACLDWETVTDQASNSGQPDELSQQLLSAVMLLPERLRILVMLHYFDGYPVQTIAEITARPLGTVTKQLSRARNCLRKILATLDQ